MPELPEVETIMRGLMPHLEGQRLEAVEVRRRDLRVVVPGDFEARVKGRRVGHLFRRSKYLLWGLDSGEALVTHLGMTGKLLYHPPMTVAEPQKHDHLWYRLSDGSSLIFNDARRFGFVGLVREDALPQHPWFSHLGPEPLEEGFTVAYLRGALQRRRGPLKTAIMDASLVVGVGNIYASEALFQAKLHPLTPACEVKPKQAEALRNAIQDVLRRAIASGGSTLRDYVRSSGDVGLFQHSFAVYGRKGQPCLICHAPIEHAVTANRATYYCPACQGRKK